MPTASICRPDRVDGAGYAQAMLNALWSNHDL
jgi:hypothetical protein